MSNHFQLPLVYRNEESGDPSPPAIDHNFPEKLATSLARLESFNKHLYRPNTYLHKWWARRSGTIFRHILKQLVADSVKQDFYQPGGLEGKVILDPMMGGGTTLHEAIRLGANVIGVDIDPIPVLQTKTSLSYTDIPHKKKVFKAFFNNLKANLDALFKTACPDCGQTAEIQFVLHGHRRKCTCREVIVVDSFMLRENHNKENVYICPNCHQVTSAPTCSCDITPSVLLIEKQIRECAECGSKFSDLTDLPYHERYIPLVVVGKCSDHGQFYKASDATDRQLITQSGQLSETLDFSDPDGFPQPINGLSIR